MNDRIQELLKQSYVTEPYYPAGNDGHPEYRTYISQEKFAELIVRECATIVMGDPVISWADSIRIKRAIDENFGVEE